MKNLNNAMLMELKRNYERAYNDIYTFHLTNWECSDNKVTISMSPYISSNHPIVFDVVTGLTVRQALDRAAELKDTITTPKQAIKLIDKLIVHHNLQEEITVHDQDSNDYDALQNNLSINPDYSIYELTPFGEVSVIYYEEEPIAILLDDPTVDDIYNSLIDLNRILNKMHK